VFRDPAELASTYTLAISFGLEGMRALLKHYRPDELRGAAFSRWYSDEVKPTLDELVRVGKDEK
jgi:hypothetical protein